MAQIDRISEMQEQTVINYKRKLIEGLRGKIEESQNRI